MNDEQGPAAQLQALQLAAADALLNAIQSGSGMGGLMAIMPADMVDKRPFLDAVTAIAVYTNALHNYQDLHPHSLGKPR